MIFGMSIFAFTIFHTALSLIGIVAGLAVLYGWLKSIEMPMMTLVFLVFTAATLLTGFLFPITALTPALVVGVIATLLLLVALYALYGRHLAGVWRPTYLVTAITCLYLNCFVLVVQSFLKIPGLNALAPNGNEPPFAAAQAVVLIAFVIAGYLSVKRYHPGGGMTAMA